MCTTANAAIFTVTFTVPFTWHHVFIGSDANTTTGYRVPEISSGLGADFMVENDTLYRSTGSQWGWAALGGDSPLLSRTSGTYRWRVPLNVVGGPGKPLQVVFNGSGSGSEAYTPVLTARPC